MLNLQRSMYFLTSSCIILLSFSSTRWSTKSSKSSSRSKYALAYSIADS